MHPIERLRWIARARGEAPRTLATEAAWTISELALDEPAALVTACRRLLESHPTVGPLWWVAATVLVAPDPEQAARQAVGELCSDATAEILAEALRQRLPGDAAVVVVCPADTVREALEDLPEAIIRVVGSSPELRSEVRGFARFVEEASGWEFDEEREVVTGAALVLVEALAAGPLGILIAAEALPLVQSARDASVPVWAVTGVGRVLNDQLLEEMLRRAGPDFDLIELGAFDAFVGPAGLESSGEALSRSGCPSAPELVVRAG